MTACSSEYDFESKYNQETEREKVFNEIFVETFGEPDAYHTWGFERPEVNETRATGEFASYVGAYPDANLWTSKGFLAPDPLTAGQKARVQYYFQMVKNPGGTPDNGIKDFFMQQVYDGGTDPMPGKSPEKYLAASGNSSYIESGEHMDHLTASSEHLHVYNFNNGNCSTNPNVSDRNQTDVNDASKQHSDEIQLMLNTPTDCFGYANSDASYVRDDRWRLVAGSVIDNYCDNDANFQSWLASKGITDDKVVDEFNRSFIGFDFDMIPDDAVFAGNKTYYNWGEEGYPGIKSIVYDYMSVWLSVKGPDGKYYIWDGEKKVDASTIGELVEYEGGATWYPYMPGTTEKVHMVAAETNQYCGEIKTFDDGLWAKYTYKEGTDEYGNALNYSYPNMSQVFDLLEDGWLRTSDSDKKWIKVGNCADGYYSDWIVSFMPADGSTVVETPDYYSRRVIAEDLGTVENTDFDYNDVVFDVVQDEVNTTLTLRAAGGTLPLRLIVVEDGYETDDKLKITDPTIEAGTNHILFNREVHEWFGVDTKVMVNTYTGKHTEYEAKTYSFTNNAVYADQVRIYVQKNGEWYEITAYVGKPAQKIAAGTDYEWLDERESIITSTRQIYNNFLKFVENQKEWGKDSYKKWYQANPKYEDEDSTGTIDTNF